VSKQDLIDFFHTDWAGMTSTDWTGLIMVLVLAGLMAAAYAIIYKPSNRDKYEQYCDFVNHEDDWQENREVKHGPSK